MADSTPREEEEFNTAVSKEDEDEEPVESDVEEESDIEEESEVGEESDVEDESEEEEEDEEEPAVGAEEEAGAEEEEAQGEGEEGEEGNPTTKTKRGKRKAKSVSNISGIEMLQTTKKTSAGLIAIDDESDEEPEEDEFYLQKFDNEMRDNYILNFHPESRTHNYEEVKALTRVTRDGRGIITDPLHKTLPFLTKYEMTRVLGQRAKQLDSGAKAFVKIPLNVIEGYHIAKLELEQKKLPFIIKRPYPNGGVEYWNVSDLEIL
jgi:DNA-directed RNA polymerase subunit K/omega